MTDAVQTAKPEEVKPELTEEQKQQKEVQERVQQAQAAIMQGKIFLTNNLLGLIGATFEQAVKPKATSSKAKHSGPSFQMGELKTAVELISKLAEAAKNIDSLGMPGMPGMGRMPGMMR